MTAGHMTTARMENSMISGQCSVSLVAMDVLLVLTSTTAQSVDQNLLQMSMGHVTLLAQMANSTK